MDDSCCLRTLLSICIYMAHNIMTNLFLTFFCHIIIDVIDMSLEFIDLFLCDDRLAILGKSQLHFCLSQCDPELSPCSEFHIL